MSMKESILVMAGMAAMVEQMNDTLMYSDYDTVRPYKKTPLTNKQLKARKKAKVARKQRKKQRRK